MAGKKDYTLQIWPPNDLVNNTKKYKIIKRSPVPLYAKTICGVTFVALGLYATAVRSYMLDVSLRELLRHECSSFEKILFILSLAIVANAILCYVFQGDFEESIMVMKNIGVELSTTKRSSIFFLRDSKIETFIRATDIVDLVILEAFKGYEVIFYLVIIRRSQSKLTIVFENLLPRRHQLETVLRGSRKVLFSMRNDDKLLVPGWKLK